MHFYEVWVRSQRYRSESPLTYQFPTVLKPGQLVVVPLQGQAVAAIVTGVVRQPPFACKDIAHVYELPPLQDTTLSLLEWLRGYYPAPIGPLTQLVLPASLPLKPVDREIVNKNSELAKIKLSLNAEQTAAVNAMRTSGTYLLHGRTGSGKTRVYAALAKKALAKSRSVLILSPEIGLTPQLASAIEELLKHPVITFHSKMTAKQRTNAWLQILTADQPQIIIGPRSALFTPIANLGLIVLDEFHEPSYKQEQQPYYYTPRVAAQLANLHDAQLLLGSATPSVSEYYLAQQKKRPIVEMREVAAGSAPVIKHLIVDNRDRSLFTTSNLLSKPLVEALGVCLERGEQSMLYLNRRGTARLLLCDACGWQALCPHCDLPLTYHNDRFILLCHICGHREPPASVCPECGNTELNFRTAGTKAIVDEIARLLPEARTQRFDTDNTKAESLEQHIQSIKSGETDILVGTQLLAKGLDLPKLTTLGIISADSSLGIPDFTARERTYQLLNQVLGRIGRGHSASATAIVQTYNPEDITLQSAMNGNWEEFYKAELAERQKFTFPPFCYLLKLSCERASAGAAEKAASEMKSHILESVPSRTRLEIAGPTPAFHERHQNRYTWQLVLKATDRRVLISVVKNLPKSGWAYDIDPINLL